MHDHIDPADPRLAPTDHDKHVELLKEQADKTIAARLARNVRAGRRRAGITGGQLALLMRKRGHRWDAAQVSRIERAGRPITAVQLADLAELLRTTADQLLNEE